MTREDVKVMIGDFNEIYNEKLLEKIIENYEDDDASYKEAYLILQKEKNISEYLNEYFSAVLDYGTSFTVIDEYGNAQIYDVDDVSEKYNEDELQKFEDYFDDYFDGCSSYDRFYKLLNPLWLDIYYIIDEYGLDKEKFLSCFKLDDGDIDYDTAQFFHYCLEFDHVSDFINEIYNSKL